jgi:hypothetical protein
MRTRRVEPVADGPAYWELLAENSEPVGVLHCGSNQYWEFLKPTGKAFDPHREIDLGRLLLDEVGISWPGPEEFANQAQQIFQQSQMFREALRNVLPWMPELIRQMYPNSPEHQARLALLFWHLVRLLDDPLLIETQAHLAYLAYHSLSAVYEAEPADDSRFRTVEQAWREAFRSWYATLAEPNRSWIFGAEAPRQRELALLEAITEAGPNERRLRRFFRETQPGRETIRRLIAGWFLARYDLPLADRLKTAVNEAARDAEAGGFLKAPAWRGARGVAFSRGVTAIVLFIYLLTSCQFVWNFVAQIGWLPSESLIMAAIYMLGGLPPLLFWLGSGRPDTSLPRLWAGILLAVVGTIMQQNWIAMMRFAHTQVMALGALCIFLLLAAYRVLLAKVRQATGFERDLGGDNGRRGLWKRLVSLRDDPAHRRCLAVWYRGLTLAFLISLLLSDLLGDSYLQEAFPPAQVSGLVWRLPGLFGGTYPALVILFTALSLFAGIFVQLLWEERPITEALA